MEETEDIRADQLITGDRVYGYGGIKTISWINWYPSSVSFKFRGESGFEIRRNDEIVHVSKRYDVTRRP